jgi:hypothetical protein
VDSSGLISNIATTNGGFNQNYPAKIDMYVNYANAGAVIVYIDTVPVLTYSGNITTNSVTTLTGVNLGQVLNTGGGGAFAGSGTSWSEIIVASSDTRGLSLQTLVPSGNGASSQWTGNYSNINELTINDSAGIGSNTANQLSLFSQSGSYTAPFISAIAISARSITANGAPQHLTLAVHEGNTTSTAGTFAPSTYYGLNQYIWQTDPITGTYWSNTTNVQIGAQSLT